MIGSLRFQYAAILVIGLSGAVAYRLAAQEVPEEPAPSEAMPELIYPEIDAPAPPPMTEAEAAQDARGSPDLMDLTPPDMSTPRSAREYRTCPDRDPRPAWIKELTGWEADRGLLVQEIYTARSYEQIVATGDCSCAVKAPSWDAAQAEYEENYAALNLRGVSNALTDFQRLSGSLHNEARRICRAQGNW